MEMPISPYLRSLKARLIIKRIKNAVLHMLILYHQHFNLWLIFIFFEFLIAMEIAKKLYSCLTKSTGSHELLDLINKIEDKNMLALVNEFFMAHYQQTPNEYFAEKFKLEDLYAISATLKCIREPNQKNTRSMHKFYEKIGYQQT